MGWKRKAAASCLILLLVGFSLHFHEPNPADHFHFHDLTLSITNQVSTFFLTNGHICPCSVATLAMPALKFPYLASLSATQLTFFFSSSLILPLIWDIFHPPEIV
jgi:hypothetical protein